MGRSLGAATIEPRVWDHVKTLLSDPAVLRMQYEQGHGDPAVNVRAEQERARLERKLTALDRGRMLRERVREITQQRADRAAELRLLEGVDAFCASVRGAVVQFVVNRIVVEDSRVIIEHVVPTGPVRLQPEHH